MLDLSRSKSILVFRSDFGRSENFLLSVIIIFRETIKYKLLCLKINSNQDKIDTTKIEPNTHLHLLVRHVIQVLKFEAPSLVLSDKMSVPTYLPTTFREIFAPFSSSFLGQKLIIAQCNNQESSSCIESKWIFFAVTFTILEHFYNYIFISLSDNLILWIIVEFPLLLPFSV